LAVAQPDFTDSGDPIVLYDHLAGRWLVTQLQFTDNFSSAAECIDVSTTK
jgi:hypothetical protein